MPVIPLGTEDKVVEIICVMERLWSNAKQLLNAIYLACYTSRNLYILCLEYTLGVLYVARLPNEIIEK